MVFMTGVLPHMSPVQAEGITQERRDAAAERKEELDKLTAKHGAELDAMRCVFDNAGARAISYLILGMS
jgi:hypothetical protein